MNVPASATAARHALGWLVAANTVGVVLAALLVWPGLNRALAPFTYGRWMPLHMDWQLYGWCALPLVGVLLTWLLPAGSVHAARQGRLAVRLWSLALALGGISWLAGISSGKLFLDWAGWARPLLPAAMTVLWFVLAAHTIGRLREASWQVRLAKGLALLVLSAVPAALYVASGPAVYPSVNPDSGGATGASLLGSTLGIIALGGALPHLLGLRGNTADKNPHALSAFWGFFATSALVYAVVDHGHASHHSAAQIIALGTLMFWAPMMCFHFRRFEWPAGARCWLRAAAVWWWLLLVSGWLTFLPEISERLKFTHALVAHAHLALAGLVTSVGAAILVALGRAPGGGAPAFWCWQLACVAHVSVLMVLGTMEATHAAEFFTGTAWVTTLLATRLATGLIMLAASVSWLRPSPR